MDLDAKKLPIHYSKSKTVITSNQINDYFIQHGLITIPLYYNSTLKTKSLQELIDHIALHDHKNEEFDDDGDGSSTDQHRQINWGSSCKIWWADGADDEEEYSSSDIGINNNISRKVKDEMEDRLFWETCMAFGYP